MSDGTRSITFDYDTSVIPHRLTGMRDPNGNIYTLQFDGNGNLYRVVFPVTDSGEPAAYWEYTYNPAGQLQTKQDPQGNLTRYYFDADGKVSSADDPQGQNRSIVYPTVSDPVRSSTFIEKDGGQWTYTYDITTGRLKEKIAPDGSTTSYTHYSDGRDKSRTEPGTNGVRYTTFYSYDTNGNVATETVPIDCAALGIDPATVANPATDSRLKVAFRYSYETGGQNRILSSSDVRGATALTTSYQYTTDAEGYLVTTVTDPAGSVTVTRQYPTGSTRDVIDANGRKTTYSYRPDRLVESITDPAGIVTAFTAYDANGNTTEQQIKDMDGTVRKTVRMEYDARNRLRKSTTIAAGQPDIVTNFGYDVNDNMTTVTDPEGNTTRYEYNYNRQVTKTTDAADKDTSFTYGATGCPSCGGGVDKLTAITDAKGQATSYAYDQMGRLQAETDSLGRVIKYTYFENGKVKEKYDATTTPEKLLIGYSYDSYGQRIKSLWGA